MAVKRRCLARDETKRVKNEERYSITKGTALTDIQIT